VVGRPFKFARVLRVVRYVDGLQTLASTIAAALPATLQVRPHLCRATQTSMQNAYMMRH
jgi:hypothetical protein